MVSLPAVVLEEVRSLLIFKGLERGFESPPSLRAHVERRGVGVDFLIRHLKFKIRGYLGVC